MRTIADRYELAESLGSGGMARVFRARDRVLERDVAIKLLREDVSEDATVRERFLREARMAGSLNNRHIIRVYDAGVDGQTPWMAMELVEGPSLRQRMTELGPYPLAAALPTFVEVLSALQAAHAADVIHRDVKPANILLSEDGSKLGDFGIAKSIGTVGADLTQFNQFLGTPKYTAPEVAMGDPATRRSDVYAAAVVFWEMLAGHPPFEHSNPLTLAMMHRTDPLPSLAEARPDLPAGLVAALEQALAKDPKDRPIDAAAFAASLQSGATATPKPPPPPPVRRLAATPAPAATAAVNDPARVVREPTAVLPRPAREVPPAAAPAGSTRSGQGSWGLAIVVGLLVVIAVVAFTIASDDGGGDPVAPGSPTPTPTVTGADGASTAPADQSPATPEETGPVPVPTTTAAPAPPPPEPSAPDPDQPSTEDPGPPTPQPAPPPEPSAPPDGGEEGGTSGGALLPPLIPGADGPSEQAAAA